jgi:DNA-directed RNA polymerase specialized sigma24 family protein
MFADPPGALTDTELVRAAQAGDGTSLGVLFGRHRAAMYAVALAILGAGPDAEDGVQDAALIAIGRLGDLRDPEAVGPWLRGIVRNTCRALRRRDRFISGELPELAAREPGPEQPAAGRPQARLHPHELALDRGRAAIGVPRLSSWRPPTRR